MLDQDAIDRLLHFRSPDAPVLSVYLTIPSDPAQLRDVETTLNSMLKPIRDYAASAGLTHDQQLSLRADADAAQGIANRAATFQGHGIGLFGCSQSGMHEEVILPGPVRDQAVITQRPYVRPMLARALEATRYGVVVVDQERAWLYEFHRGELQNATERIDQGTRKPDFAGWHGLQEWGVRNRAGEQVRRHYRATAEAVHSLVQATGTRLLVVGGHETTLAQFLPFLSNDLPFQVVGTFAVDPHTVTAAQVRDHAERAIAAFEQSEEARQVASTFETVAAHGAAAAGLPWCLAAANESAIEQLCILEDEQAPGRVCDECGWLGLGTGDCPHCGAATRQTPDVIDDMVAAVLNAGGHVANVHQDPALAEQLVAATLRFRIPVPAPAAPGNGVAPPGPTGARS